MTLPGGTSVDLTCPQHAVGQVTPDYASWTLRVIAALLDAVIAAGLAFLAPVGIGTEFPFLGEPASFTGATPTAESWFHNPWVVTVVVVTLVMQAYLGVTPGKLVTGIAVVNEADARPLGLVRTVLRWLAHLVDGLLFIGYLRPLWNARRRTFADSIVGSVVLATRRPLPHRWLTRRTAPDVGPPATWEAAATPTWRPAATWLAALTCGLGGLFGFGPSTTEYRAPVDLQCAMSTWDSGPAGLTGATLHTTTSTGTITRLGVTRRMGEPPQDVSATWTWSGHPSPSDAVMLRLVVTGADGTSTTHDFSFSDTSASTATMVVPSDALRGVGDAWSWTASIVVNDMTSTPCTGTVTGLFT
ncbi:MAG TPA: RDD family protein [Cellulomonadaceae bacterium]|nr:RDD family protein [Cellulomonadaceae bacterium]